ncbi:RIP metalloprotease RseP [Aliiroseovarius subalbicans]|uniref:RIP metalloprotease RseP n=1 Tax=Aliiroseovarius subalbicans TaxID=2925840 RepID=UPI001F5ABF71|nr:RIP metalloprotease RseP [Aliiroseovarius subalbicans]MCI2398368.1 RIP metalloprotease RseP [Aliiroseovarius subalbicans]
MDFIPSFGGLGLTILAFLVALTIIVAVHEYGHYIIGRISGIKADVFSIGVGPVLAKRTDKHGTQWQIAALPVGGYVKFHGDANVASGKADEEELAEMDAGERRSTLHGAPLWARAATVAAGPIFNFVLSGLIFAGVLFSQGIASDPLTVDEVAQIPGIEGTLDSGDLILEIDGRTAPALAEFPTFIAELPEQSPLNYLVERKGGEHLVSAPHPFPPLVGSVSPQSAAVDAGIKPDDLIVTIDGDAIATFEQLRQRVVNGGGAELVLGLIRDGESLDVTLTPRRVDIPLPEGGFETRWLIGINGAMIFTPATRTPGMGEALSYGATQTVFIVKSSLSGLYHMVTGAISSCNLRGPIGIAETSGQAASQGLSSFIWFVAVLSTAVGLLNLFPIPVLDGGHLMFHAYEAVRGKPPSDKVLNILMTIGVVLVLSIMALGLTNDLFCP